jgi:hypothetical protein
MAWNYKKSKLTRKQCEIIRLAVVGKTRSQGDMAREFDLSLPTISKIINTLYCNKHWWDRTEISQPYWPPQPLFYAIRDAKIAEIRKRAEEEIAQLCATWEGLPEAADAERKSARPIVAAQRGAPNGTDERGSGEP